MGSLTNQIFSLLTRADLYLAWMLISVLFVIFRTSRAEAKLVKTQIPK